MKYYDLKLDNFIKLNALKDIQDSFANATGFAVNLVDQRGQSIYEGTNDTEFCKKLRSEHQSLECCVLSSYLAGQKSSMLNKPCVYKCHAGLINVSVPIIINNFFLGAMLAGQVKNNDIPQDLDKITTSFDWLEDTENYKLYSQIDYVPREQVQAVANTLFFIVNFVVDKSISELSEKATLNPPMKKHWLPHLSPPSIETYQQEFIDSAYSHDKEKILNDAIQARDSKLFENSLQEYIDYLFNVTDNLFIIRTRLLELDSMISETLLNYGYDKDEITDLSQNYSEFLQQAKQKDDVLDAIIFYKGKIFDLFNSNQNNLAQRIIEYINSNYADEITVEKIAQQFHFSSSHISRVLKKEVGISYSNYVNQIRIHHAKHFLKNSSLKIKFLAEKVGYAEISHFNRVFKKTVGISPSKYRSVFSENKQNEVE